MHTVKWEKITRNMAKTYNGKFKIYFWYIKSCTIKIPVKCLVVGFFFCLKLQRSGTGYCITCLGRGVGCQEPQKLSSNKLLPFLNPSLNLVSFFSLTWHLHDPLSTSIQSFIFSSRLTQADFR